MPEKIEPNFNIEEINSEYKAKPGSELPEIAKKIIEEAKKISDEEVKDLNEEIEEFYTNFLDIGLEELKAKLTPEEFEEFNESISKYPIVDLACGRPNKPSRKLFSILFKEKFLEGDYNYYSKSKSEIDAMGIAEPKEYIGVDKYHENIPPEELRDKVRFEKKDIIEYLRTLPDNSVNIFIGGFDTEISRPKIKVEITAEGKPIKTDEDKYRAIMMAEIARVLPEEGYCLAVESHLRGQYKGQEITPESLGLKKVFQNIRIPRFELFKKSGKEEKKSV